MNGPRGGGYERMRQMRLAPPWGNGAGRLEGRNFGKLIIRVAA